jgi:hypothetical protein
VSSPSDGLLTHRVLTGPDEERFCRRVRVARELDYHCQIPAGAPCSGGHRRGLTRHPPTARHGVTSVGLSKQSSSHPRRAGTRSHPQTPDSFA